ncbi:ATP-dependent DNA helicase RecQ [Rhodoligotrophos appendicifer]|uniref:DNA helicase RecQ n=1 Tax=Rhodoligotrophos appendicifer TaxID=987056 RepID=UPI001FEB8460|nr:DNA helicase RecQ [Rhodoligotrophos appendicifer]
MTGLMIQAEARQPEGASAELSAILRENFGFSDLRPGQRQAIDAVLAGHNVLAVMPTGAGKSLCYQLPALVMGGLTIVVSPLVALMRDQVAALRLNGIAAAAINSDQSREENVGIWRDVQGGRVRLLYLSPERLMTERMLAALQACDVGLIAIDEAHCISQWGPAFRPDYEGLAQLRHRFPRRPIIALTATADPVTQADIKAKLFDDEAETVITGFDRPNLSLAVLLKSNWKKQVSAFVGARSGSSGIVYCLSRRKTEEVAEDLRADGHTALAFHAGMDTRDKQQVQNRFMTEPGIVVVATIAFGMGIDKPDVRWVLHTDLPGSTEAYYQEIGRAGRDGEPAETLLLYGLDDIRMRRTFIAQEEASDERKRRENKRLDALIAYCEAPECRRRVLLRHFGQESEACGNCDNCLDPVPTRDGKVLAQKALSAIYRTGQRFGASHIVDVLRGAINERITASGHDSLPTFGTGRDLTKQEWQGILRQMVASGVIEIDIAGFGGLRLTATGAALLKGEGEFRYRADRIAPTRREKRAAASAVLDASGADLLSVLKGLRMKLAKERDVPAYVIFSDRSLIDMAQRRPRSAGEFAEVFGVGQTKVKEFGDLFLREIAAAR